MKRLLLLGACSFMVANAALIPALDPVNFELGIGGSAVSIGDTGDTLYQYTYTATLNDQARFQGNNRANEYFVLYDFEGYRGVSDIIPGPTNAWDITWSSESAFPPGISSANGGPQDDPSVNNLLFRYVGNGTLPGRAWTFEVLSEVGAGFTMSNFVSSASNASLPGTYVRNWGDVLVPALSANEGSVPEPFSMGLIGGGLAALGLLRRYKR